ncbi:hypothetical protein SAMN05444673_4382 [Bacillus sp. OV166]|uniref:hypothetical protein n=1 Tax=Bacillus sp. OV166 TaxID=1882763 RepID=UPI000A2AC7AE|nr:hypothetical protein [Bacillus sp. OV166]SMQ81566.1 hypothetical protein SAMN05444673_4382 [Bacillus sp. OV166]
MFLLSGVTGFFGSKDDQPPYHTKNDVKREFFNSVTKVGGKTGNFFEPEYSTSYYEGVFKYKGRTIYALFNKYQPLMGFVSKVDEYNFSFIDVPELLNGFRSYFKILSVKDLTTPFEIKEVNGKIFVKNKHQLKDVEVQQALYWKPQTIGEVIFNSWD